MVYTLLDHRNDVIKCSKLKRNREPQASGFTAVFFRVCAPRRVMVLGGNLAKNRQILRLRKGCLENITTLDHTAFVVFKISPQTKSFDFISKRMRRR